MTIESEVKETILRGQSGALSLVEVDGCSESSLSWNYFEMALSELNAPNSLKRNLDKGVVFPSGKEQWEWLETAAKNPKFRFKVNGQMASQAIEIYSGQFSDGTQARDLRNWEKIRKEQRQTEQERIDAGYGTSRMGGWVEM